MDLFYGASLFLHRPNKDCKISKITSPSPLLLVLSCGTYFTGSIYAVALWNFSKNSLAFLLTFDSLNFKIWVFSEFQICIFCLNMLTSFTGCFCLNMLTSCTHYRMMQITGFYQMQTLALRTCGGWSVSSTLS